MLGQSQCLLLVAFWVKFLSRLYALLKSNLYFIKYNLYFDKFKFDFIKYKFNFKNGGGGDRLVDRMEDCV